MEPDLLYAIAAILNGLLTVTDLVLIFVLLCLLFCSAVVSASEVAFFSLTPGQVEELRTEGHNKAYYLYKKPDKLLATILISNNFVNVGIVIISSYLVDSLFDFSANPFMGFIIQVVVVTFLILLFGEIIPKLYANRAQKQVAAFMETPLTVTAFLCTPLSWLLIHSTSLIRTKISQKHSISMDQLSKALELTKEEEINEEKEILEGIVRFSNISVSDIIRPRINIVAVDHESSFAQVKEAVIEYGYSRIPIYDENLDNISGILYIKDLLPYLQEGDDFRWQKLLRPAYFVPETKKVNDLLEEFQSKKVHLAIVVDEYGGTTGMVTMEDILEEIVGDINDETDEKEQNYIRIQNNAYIFEGQTLLYDFEKTLGLGSECFQEIEGEADTLAGLLLEIKGELPRKNEVIIYRRHKFTILDVDNRRIKKIKYETSIQ